MQLTPRYGPDPIITLDGNPSDILAAVTRQRRRLATTLASFTDEQWQHPSRCAGWTNRDVMVHLESTNGFWTFSAASGLQGKPTRLLATFDPVASPAQLVAAAEAVTASEVLAKFEASNAALEATLSALSDADWLVLAEAPPGHISISALAHHALWDSWVHERDVLLPLGAAVAEEHDEVTAILRYSAALAPAFALSRGKSSRGSLAVDATEPDTAFVVDIGDHVHVRSGSGATDVRLQGNAVDLIEAFSIRAPLTHVVPDSHRWMLDGVAEIFDVA